jgi:hypothetical protein
MTAPRCEEQFISRSADYVHRKLAAQEGRERHLAPLVAFVGPNVMTPFTRVTDSETSTRGRKKSTRPRVG